MSDTVLLMCYNRGCGQRFDPGKNTDSSCTFHPGLPFFHDAYKGWSCCNKKTTDFTEFLNIKGCTKSYHSNVKPPEPEKPKVEESDKKEEVYTFESHKPPEAAERPDASTPMVRLPSNVAPSLKTALENLKQKVCQKVAETDAKDQVIQIGTSCKNNGCTQVYQGEHSNSETCYYHPGIPVFHEGMKYWSCCVRKTSDFNNFLEQAGCETGRHTWIKKEDPSKKTTCRYDWHQTGTHVVISVYSKVPHPDLSYVEANPVKLNLYIVFGEEKSVFDMEMVLFGVVNVEMSSVTFLGSKVEIKLRKADATSWSKLLLPVEKVVNDVERSDSLDELEAKPLPVPKITELE